MRAWMFVMGVSMAACSGSVDSPGTSGGGGSGGATLGGVGDACVDHGDCASGVCVDMAAVVSGCTGKVCTLPCAQNSDCPQAFDQPDCEKTSVGEICLYGAWAVTYCGK